MTHSGGGNRAGRRSTFGSIRKLPSGRFQARYTGPDGRQHRAPHTFATKTDARAWLNTRHADITRDEWRAERPRGSAPTFAPYARRWLETRRAANGEPLKPRTRDHYDRLLDRLLVPAFGDLRVSAITPEHVDAWWDDLGDSTPTLRAHAYTLLRTILNDAVTDRHLKANPCVIRGAGTTRRKRGVTLPTSDELAAIIDAMPAKYAALVLVSVWCALRFGEATELRRRDVDLERGLIHVQRGVTRVNGEFVVGTPKSAAGVRAVTIPPHIAPAIERHLDAHVLTGADALIFPARDGVSHLQPSTLYRSFYRARERAGRPDLRWHDLRHLGATLTAQTPNATLAEIMERLGHSTPQAALRYQQVARNRPAQIAAALSDLAERDD